MLFDTPFFITIKILFQKRKKKQKRLAPNTRAKLRKIYGHKKNQKTTIKEKLLP